MEQAQTDNAVEWSSTVKQSKQTPTLDVKREEDWFLKLMTICHATDPIEAYQQVLVSKNKMLEKPPVKDITTVHKLSLLWIGSW